MSCRRTKLSHEFYEWEDDIAGAIDGTLKPAAFFGNKPQCYRKTPPGRQDVLRVTARKSEGLSREGYRQFLTGIFGEFERGALETLLKLRDRHPEVRLVLFLGRREHLSIYSQLQPVPWAYRTADSVIVMEEREDRVTFALLHCSTLVYSYRGLYAPSFPDSHPTGTAGPNPPIRLIDAAEAIWKAADKTDANGEEEPSSPYDENG